jgi:hypothetical protein
VKKRRCAQIGLKMRAGGSGGVALGGAWLAHRTQVEQMSERLQQAEQDVASLLDRLAAAQADAAAARGLLIASRRAAAAAVARNGALRASRDAAVRRRDDALVRAGGDRAMTVNVQAEPLSGEIGRRRA